MFPRSKQNVTKRNRSVIVCSKKLSISHKAFYNIKSSILSLFVVLSFLLHMIIRRLFDHRACIGELFLRSNVILGKLLCFSLNCSFLVLLVVSFVSSFLHVYILYDKVSFHEILDDKQNLWVMKLKDNCVIVSNNTNIDPLLIYNFMSLVLVTKFTFTELLSSRLIWNATRRRFNGFIILPAFWKNCSGSKLFAEFPCCIAAGPDSSTNSNINIIYH